MKTETKKFLEFNGNTIYFVAIDGQYWIALKPICEALNVDFEAQRKNLNEDEILALIPSMQTVVAADGKLRKMLCLPEFYIYGWIFQIQSQSIELLKYKWECYRVLYNYFHGVIAGRKELLLQKAKAEIEIGNAMNTLDTTMAITIGRSKKIISQLNKKLRALDGELIQEERDLFSS